MPKFLDNVQVAVAINGDGTLLYETLNNPYPASLEQRGTLFAKQSTHQYGASGNNSLIIWMNADVNNDYEVSVNTIPSGIHTLRDTLILGTSQRNITDQYGGLIFLDGGGFNSRETFNLYEGVYAILGSTRTNTFTAFRSDIVGKVHISEYGRNLRINDSTVFGGVTFEPFSGTGASYVTNDALLVGNNITAGDHSTDFNFIIGNNIYCNSYNTMLIGKGFDTTGDTTNLIAIGKKPYSSGVSSSTPAILRSNSLYIGMENRLNTTTDTMILLGNSNNFGMNSVPGPTSSSIIIGHNNGFTTRSFYGQFNGESNLRIGHNGLVSINGSISAGTSMISIGNYHSVMGLGNILIGNKINVPYGAYNDPNGELRNSIIIGNGVNAANFGLVTDMYMFGGRTTIGSAYNNAVVLGSANTNKLICNVTSITTGSDERIKEDIELADIARCLEDVRRLPVKRFKYKKFAHPNALDTHRTGFIAQDVEKVFPKDVTVFSEEFDEYDSDGNIVRVEEENEDGEIQLVNKKFTMEDLRHISMSDGLATLWAAVQCLADKVDKLQTELLNR